MAPQRLGSGAGGSIKQSQNAIGSGPENPAGYGKSCTNCQRAKCKCMLRAEGGACERCHRLGKECQPMITSRRRQAKRTTASRTAQLEEKLDDLVSILKSGQHQSSVSFNGVLPPVNPVSKVKSANTSALDSLAEAATTDRDSSVYPSEGLIPSHYSTTAPYPAAIIVEPTPQEAAAQLVTVRGWLNNFPFMQIPQSATPESLSQERPFLWLCIKSLTHMSVTQQRALSDRIRRELSQRVIMDHERTMDLLLGLILVLSWATQNTGPRMKPFLVLYSQMAAAVIFEMGLLRDPREEHFAAIGKIWGKKMGTIRDRTAEEKRAGVSLWFLTSMCNMFTGKVETLRWTTHMSECLESLEQADQYPSDAILAAFVRLQLISEDANRLLIRDLTGNSAENDVPTYVHKQRLLERLQPMREKISTRFPLHFCLNAQLLTTQGHVHGIGLFSEKPMPDDARVDGLYKCLMTVRAWYDAFFRLPLIEIPALPFHTYICLSTMQVMLYRITTCDFPMWDKSIVRSTADILEIIDRTINVFQNVPSVYPLRDDDDIGNLYTNGAKHLKNLRATWQPMVVRHLANLPTPNSQAMGVSPSGAATSLSETLLGEEQGADFNDISWMADIFGPWEL